MLCERGDSTQHMGDTPASSSQDVPEVRPNSLDLTSSGNLTGNEAGTTAI